MTKLPGKLVAELIYGNMVFVCGTTLQNLEIKKNLVEEVFRCEERKRGRGCVEFPFPLFFSDELVLLPDFILFGPEKQKNLKEYYFEGAPDLIIEVWKKGRIHKNDYPVRMEIYERNRVPEYWLVDGKTESIACYVLRENDKYELKQHLKTDAIQSKTLPWLRFQVSALFQYELAHLYTDKE